MSMQGLTCTVELSRLTVIKEGLLVSNGSNQYECYVTFDSSWDNMDKVVKFETPDGLYQNTILANGSCIIPTNILYNQTSFSIGVFGVLDEEAIYSTNVVDIDIVTGSDTSGFTPLTEDEWVAYLSQINDVYDETLEQSNNAETWAKRSPYIDEGYWYVWDNDTSAFVNTEVSALGELTIKTDADTDVVIDSLGFNTVYNLETIDTLTINEVVTSYYESKIYFTTGDDFETDDFVYPDTVKTIGVIELTSNSEYIITICNNIMKLENINI